ncbi:MerR family transcriptional regulator [Alteribacter populi]|uniref:MerR family transcriptional regulator n=1 Tax=Alteribacter populi TaxID=2011011 RepID=UPI000BBB0DE4|nr:MerR family transcriptional regulator [Alteribacter populi]
MLKVSEVAKKTAISVRTLHYYEEIGLLIPSDKNDYGHRMYNEDNLFTLQQIIIWRDLGFSLKQIKTLIHHTKPVEAIEKQVEQLKEEQMKLAHRQKQLIGLKHLIEIENKLDWEILLSMIKRDEVAEENRKQYVEMLKELPKLEDENADTREWLTILASFKRHQEKNTPFDDQELKKLCIQVEKKAEQMFQGEEAMQNEFWEIRRSETKSANLRLYPIHKDVIDYIEAAMNYHALNPSKN